MGIRFRRSKSLGKFGKINLTKGGLGLSAGPRGARIGVGPRGAYTSAGIPGTGLYSINYAKKGKKGKIETDQAAQQVAQAMPAPKELKASSLPAIIIVVSIIFLFIIPVLGVLGLVGSIAWLILNAKTPRAQALKAFNDGNRYYMSNNYKTALECFEEAINYEPAADSLLPYLSNLSFMAEDYKRAEYYLNDYLKNKPDDMPAQFNYALALSSLERHEEAIPILQNLPDEIKTELPYIIALGNAFLETNRQELAINVLEGGPTRKRSVDENMLLFRYTLGRAYKDAGDNKKAINQLQKVYAADTGFEEVGKLLEELQNNN